MSIPIRSFAKINLGLCIGDRRSDGFHELRTVYQTVSACDTIRVDLGRGTGIDLRCKDSRVPLDETNTCWRIADRVLKTLKQRAKVIITIDKQLPTQGGLGAASSNAVATMLALEKALGEALEPEDRLRIASEVGSDLPLFLVGGTVLGIGRGEQVWPVQDLPSMALVLVTPDIGVSTPEAFHDWDEQFGRIHEDESSWRSPNSGLTRNDASDRMTKFSQSAYAWLAGSLPRFFASELPGQSAAGVPVSAERNSSADKNGGRVENPLLSLVRAGMSNDFERVVFPKHPRLRELKRELERQGARYASLSGSGSTLYGLFQNAEGAEAAAQALNQAGIPARAVSTLSREQYWRQMYQF